MGQLPSIINIMNKTLLGILCLHICLLIGLSQSRQARMDSEWKSKRSIGARDGGQQKFQVDENVDDPCPSGRDGGQQKFPSPDPCNRKKRSEQSGRDGGQQKFPSPGEKRSGIVSDTDPTSLQTGLGIEKKAELNPYNRMGNLQKRLNPNHRMAPDFSKRSAQAEWQTNTNPLFRPLNENTDDGANDEPNIVSVKRSAQADWQDLPDVFRPLPQTENTIVQVKRGEDMNPFNRMAEVNPFNRMAGPPSKRNKCASNSPSVEYDESMLTECCNVWFPTTPDRSGRVKDIVVFRACSKYLP